jgi:hypothetical protein
MLQWIHFITTYANSKPTPTSQTARNGQAKWTGAAVDSIEAERVDAGAVMEGARSSCGDEAAVSRGNPSGCAIRPTGDSPAD